MVIWCDRLLSFRKLLCARLLDGDIYLTCLRFQSALHDGAYTFKCPHVLVFSNKIVFPRLGVRVSSKPASLFDQPPTSIVFVGCIWSQRTQLYLDCHIMNVFRRQVCIPLKQCPSNIHGCRGGGIFYSRFVVDRGCSEYMH